MPIDFTLNLSPVRYDGDPAMPLLWYLRDHARLTGTKFGCGIGYCGACTAHLDGAATPSCVVPLSAVGGRRVTTIEGLASDGRLHPVQPTWSQEDVAQRGYCQAATIMPCVD